MTRIDQHQSSKLTFAESAAPSTPASGLANIYVKTDGKLYLKDDAGTETDLTSTGQSGTPYEVDYVEKTTSTSITATAEDSADTIVTAGSVAFDGSTVALIEFYAEHLQPDTAGILILNLFEDGSDIGRLADADPNVASTRVPLGVVSRRMTPTNASHTYSVRAWTTAGTATVAAGAGGNSTNFPAYIRISKLT